MVQLRPFVAIGHLLDSASRIWEQLSESDWLEAFCHHPKIGEKKAAAPQASESREWARREQAGTQGADAKILDELYRANTKYEDRFGFIFIVCATGKTAEEMLALLEQRLHNSRAVEIRIAAEEQSKITRLRLEKLLRGE